MNQQDPNGQNFQQPMNGQNYQPSQNYQQAPQPTAATTAPTPPTPPKKSGKKVFIIIGAIVLALALLVGGFFLLRPLFNKAPTAEGPIAGVAADHPLQQVDPTEISTIELYPDCEVDKSDLEEYASLINERLAVLGSTYNVTAEDDKIVMVVEKALLGQTAAERTSTVALITSRGNIAFGESEYPAYKSPTKDSISEISVVDFNRAEFLADHRLDLRDERYAQLEALNADTLYGIEVKLTNEGSSLLQSIMDSTYSSSGAKLSILHNYLKDSYKKTSNSFMGSVVLTNDGDASCVYVISPGCTYQKNAELMKKLLEQEDECDFGLIAEIADEPNWEVDGKYMGQNQKTELSGDTIIAEFTPDEYSLAYTTEVKFAEYESGIKKRLDALGIEYMFGTSGFDDKTYCIKVRPEDFAPDFFRLIFGNGKRVQSAFDNVSDFYGTPTVVDNNGNLALRFTTSYTSAELLQQYNIPNNTVYLVVNDVTIASADITQVKEDPSATSSYYKYCLDFSNFLCFGDVTNVNDGKNVLDLILHIYDNSIPSVTGTFRFRSADGSAANIGDLNWKYEPLSAEDKRVFQLLSDNGYLAQKIIDARSTLEITIDLPIDDNLPTAFLSEVQKVYELCSFDSGAFSKVVFVIKDESKNSPADKFHITAEKDTYSGKMRLSDIVSGPKFSKYWSDIYDMMNQNTFYTQRSW